MPRCVFASAARRRSSALPSPAARRRRPARLLISSCARDARRPRIKVSENWRRRQTADGWSENRRLEGLAQASLFLSDRFFARCDAVLGRHHQASRQPPSAPFPSGAPFFAHAPRPVAVGCWTAAGCRAATVASRRGARDPRGTAGAVRCPVDDPWGRQPARCLSCRCRARRPTSPLGLDPSCESVAANRRWKVGARRTSGSGWRGPARQAARSRLQSELFRRRRRHRSDAEASTPVRRRGLVAVRRKLRCESSPVPVRVRGGVRQVATG